MDVLTHRIVACDRCLYSGSTVGNATHVRPGDLCARCREGYYVKFVPQPSRGAVEALHAIAERTHQDIATPASWWGLISEIHGIARRGIGS